MAGMSRSVTRDVRDDVPVSMDGGAGDPASERARLTALLRRLGADDAEIDEALDTQTTGALALEAAVRRGRPALSKEEAARRAGLTDSEFADLWRALGLATTAGPQRVPPGLAD